jgi:polyisoprenoid-binding protein YceI
MKSLVLASTLLAAVAGAHADVGTYAIDPSHTFAFWEIGHFGTSTNRGRFPVKEGVVQFDRAGKAAKAEITIDTSAPNSGVVALDKHLQSKDFFNAAEFPTAKFVADKFNFNGDKVAEATGTLTLLGKSNPVTLKASNFNCYQNPMLKREVCGGDFETTIARSQWGVNWGLNFGFPDAVHLVVQVEAVKQ